MKHKDLRYYDREYMVLFHKRDYHQIKAVLTQMSLKALLQICSNVRIHLWPHERTKGRMVMEIMRKYNQNIFNDAENITTCIYKYMPDSKLYKLGALIPDGDNIIRKMKLKKIQK